MKLKKVNKKDFTICCTLGYNDLDFFGQNEASQAVDGWQIKF
jgi:hypothetical protein